MKCPSAVVAAYVAKQKAREAFMRECVTVYEDAQDSMLYGITLGEARARRLLGLALIPVQPSALT